MIADVVAALAKALEKLPADRFESAKTFADALANTAFVATSSTGATIGMAPRDTPAHFMDILARRSRCTNAD